MVSLEDLKKEKLGEGSHLKTENILIYDQTTINLESFYFWILDYLRDVHKLEIIKLTDYYDASAGSAFFSELSQKMSILLSKGMETVGAINRIIKAIMAIINEIKYLETRLKLYNQLKSSNLDDVETSLKALKSIWLDYVDSQRGGSSIHSLSSNFNTGFSTLRDIFMYAEDETSLKKLIDKGIINKVLYEHYKKGEENGRTHFLKTFYENKIINKRVYNIASARLREFYNWLETSELEIRSRYNILKSYLKHEINALITYLEFAKPYLRMARKLMVKNTRRPDLVSIFETSIAEISIYAKGQTKELEKIDEKTKEKIKEKYVPFYEINILSRSIPTAQKIQFHNVFTHIGRIELKIRSYILTEEEYKEILADEDLKDILYIQGLSDTFLKEISKYIFDIYLFDIILEDKELKEKIAKKLNKNPEDIKFPTDIRWDKEIIKIIDEKYPDLLDGIRWILKYVENQSNKKEDTKKEDKPEKIEEPDPIEDLIDVLHLLVVTPLNIFEGLEIIKSEKMKEKIKKINDKYKKELEDFENSAKQVTLKLYIDFKKTFGMLV